MIPEAQEDLQDAGDGVNGAADVTGSEEPTEESAENMEVPMNKLPEPESQNSPQQAPSEGDSANKDNEDYLDPDEDIDEEELDEMDYEMDNELSNPGFVQEGPAENVQLKAIANTQVAVEQIVENNFNSIPALLHTIQELQQQQLYQLNMLQSLQLQLMNTDMSKKTNGVTLPNGLAIPPVMDMLNNARGMLPLPKVPVSSKDNVVPPIPPMMHPSFPAPNKPDTPKQGPPSSSGTPLPPAEGKFPFISSPKSK